MKKSYIYLILILFVCLNQVWVNGQTIQPVERSIGKFNISIDPRMELLTTVQLLTSSYQLNRNLPYSKDILNYFEFFSSHEAVLMTNTLMQNGFSRDAPVNFMLALSQPLELEPKIAYRDGWLALNGGGNYLELYRNTIKQFAEISNFETFWNSKETFYSQILDLSIAEISGSDLNNDVENYFNEPKEEFNIIIMPSFTGGIGGSVDGIIYSCVGAADMKDGIPYLNRDYFLQLVWHEFSHSFVNGETYKHSDRVNSASEDKLYEPIKSYMLRQGYSEWEICVNEHIVRAVNVRLHELHLGIQEAKAALENELNQGFIYIEPLVEKLKDFEIQRDKNNVTFSEYYPELLNVLDSLQKIEYWKQFDLNFSGPIYGPITDEKVAIIYPTHDLDTESLKIAQEEASKIFDFISQFKGGITLFADTIALKTDLSEHGIMAYGTVESNLFLKHYVSIFPFRIENQTIYADREYTDQDLKFITCVPNPFNLLKGMSIHTALSNKAIQDINEAFYENDFPFLSEDYILFLNRETVVNRGFYKKDENWRF